MDRSTFLVLRMSRPTDYGRRRHAVLWIRRTGRGRPRLRQIAADPSARPGATTSFSATIRDLQSVGESRYRAATVASKWRTYPHPRQACAVRLIRTARPRLQASRRRGGAQNLRKGLEDMHELLRLVGSIQTPDHAAAIRSTLPRHDIHGFDPLVFGEAPDSDVRRAPGRRCDPSPASPPRPHSRPLHRRPGYGARWRPPPARRALPSPAHCPRRGGGRGSPHRGCCQRPAPRGPARWPRRRFP